MKEGAAESIAQVPQELGELHGEIRESLRKTENPQDILRLISANKDEILEKFISVFLLNKNPECKTFKVYYDILVCLHKLGRYFEIEENVFDVCLKAAGNRDEFEMLWVMMYSSLHKADGKRRNKLENRAFCEMIKYMNVYEIISLCKDHAVVRDRIIEEYCKRDDVTFDDLGALLYNTHFLLTDKQKKMINEKLNKLAYAEELAAALQEDNEEENFSGF